MQTKHCSVPEALEEIRETITKYTPQGPRNHQSDFDRVEYLHDAVIGVEWAKSALTQSIASTPAWTFQQLYTALDAAWLQEQRQQSARRSTNIHKTLIHGTNIHYDSCSDPDCDQDHNHFDIHYGRYNRQEGQHIYGVPRRLGSTSSDPRHTHHRYPRPNNRPNHRPHNNLNRNCFCCGSNSHLLRDCPKFRKLTQIINERLTKNPGNVKKILFELCQQTEEILDGCASVDQNHYHDGSPSPSHDPDPVQTESYQPRSEPDPLLHNILMNTEHQDSLHGNNHDIFDPTDF